MAKAKKETFYKVEFVNWSEDYDYTICRDLKEVLMCLELAQGDLDIEPEKGEAPTSVTITGIGMTERQYSNFIKKIEP